MSMSNFFKLRVLFFLSKQLPQKCSHVRTLQRDYTTCKKTLESSIFQTKQKDGRNLCTYSENKKYPSPFLHQMELRREQAKSSVFIELNDKVDISQAVASCECHGAIKSLFSYNGESNNIFLLLEYANSESADNLIHNAQCLNISDTFPTVSRLMKFSKTVEHEPPKSTVQLNDGMPHPAKRKERKSVSQMIEDLYASERLTELDVRLRFFLCRLLKDSLSGIFPHCDVIPFGSSVNGIGRQGCDLDMVIRQYPLQAGPKSEFSFMNKTCLGHSRELQRKSVYVLGELFSSFLPGIYGLKRILNARVPIVKFSHRVLQLECDISVNNVSAVLMSEILFFCGEVDPRVRPLLHVIKKWAREANVTYDTPGSWITNFGLSLLSVFFLQNRADPILPPLCDALQIVGTECSADFSIEYLMPLSELQTKASSNTESLAVLLKEFLLFLSCHPFRERHLSVLSGASRERSPDSPLCVQYPMEEGANVTKNVALSELRDMGEKARLSAEHLSAQLRGGSAADLSVALGLPALQRLYGQRNRKLDVSALLAEDSRKKVRRKTF